MGHLFLAVLGPTLLPNFGFFPDYPLSHGVFGEGWLVFVGLTPQRSRYQDLSAGTPSLAVFGPPLIPIALYGAVRSRIGLPGVSIYRSCACVPGTGVFTPTNQRVERP